MRNLIIILFVCCSLFSQESIEDLLINMQKAQSEIETLQSNFFQKKTSKLFKTPQELSGIIYFKKPDFIKWEYTNPKNYIIFIQRDKFQIYYPALKKVKEGKVVRLRGKIFSVLFAQEPLEKLKSYFTIELRKRKMEYILILSPQVYKLKKYWKSWTLTINRSNFLPISIEILEKDGDLTYIEFKDLKVNIKMEDEIFKLKLPPDVTVESYSKSIQ